MKVKDWLQGLPGLLFGLAITGFVCLGLGVYYNNTLISTIGGSLFGVSLGGLIGSWDFGNLRNDVRTILKSSLSARLTSSDSELDYYRRKWHLYNLTHLDGKFVWRHAILDFGKTYIPGSVLAKIVSSDIEGRSRKYIYTGICRDQRFIIIGQPEKGIEPCVVSVYPFMGETFRRIHPGICFIRTWDGLDMVNPTLISEKAIRNWDKFGTVPDDIGQELARLWERHFREQNLILPTLENPPEGKEEGNKSPE